MLLTQAGHSNESASYDRSSSKRMTGSRHRSRKSFEKTSYRDSYPIRCTNTDNCNFRTAIDVETRQMALNELER